MTDDFEPALTKVSADINSHQLDQAYKKARKLEIKVKEVWNIKGYIFFF
jgi:hypothetical protein